MHHSLQDLLRSSTSIDTAIFKKIKDCLVIAPHPDDESLGCGGLIASLRQSGINVHVIFTTDGSMSHPNSQNTNEIARCKLREQEAIAALQVLGVEEQYIDFFRGKDSALPTEGEIGFLGFVAQMIGIITTINPGLVLVPYEFDPHRDHRASWQITAAALEEYEGAEVWQYLIWLYTLGDAKDIEPLTNIPGGIQYLPMAKHKNIKKEAIEKHQSQLIPEIFEDPDGFLLKDTVLENFYGDREYYIKMQ